MEFRIADTFTDSLSRLTGAEQKAAKTTAFDLQLNPVNPGLGFHKLDKAKDKNFWSVRVSSDIRLSIHKTQSSLLLCYVDHHDKVHRFPAADSHITHAAPLSTSPVISRRRKQVLEVRRVIEHRQFPLSCLPEAEKLP